MKLIPGKLYKLTHQGIKSFYSDKELSYNKEIIPKGLVMFLDWENLGIEQEEFYKILDYKKFKFRFLYNGSVVWLVETIKYVNEFMFEAKL